MDYHTRREQLTVELVTPTGQADGTATVEDAHTAGGLLHRAFSVVLFDGQGRTLLQRRAHSKLRYPGQWAPATCGHPSPGEHLPTAGQHRVHEELGATGVELREVGTVVYDIDAGDGNREREYDHILIGFFNGAPAPNPDEVAEVSWVGIEELDKLLADDADGIEGTYGEWLKTIWPTARQAALAGGEARIGGDTARDPWESEVFAYWDNKRSDAINLHPGSADGFYHSHFSIVPFNSAVLQLEEPDRERAILRELHRLENLQAVEFTATLGDLPPTARVLDSGCGRGGTAFHLHERYGCAVEGVDFSPYRLSCASQEAERRGVAAHVTFHLGNMNATGRPDHHYDAVLINEAAEHLASMYEVTAEVARLLKPGGLYTIATWVANDRKAQQGWQVEAIDANYHTRIHTRYDVIAAMIQNHIVPIDVTDHTEAAIPHWQLRINSAHRTGVEEPFLSAFSERAMNYLFITGEYQPDARPADDSAKRGRP